MKILKKIIVYLIVLIAFFPITTLVLKIIGLIFQTNFENIWSTGCQCSFVAWLILILWNFTIKYLHRYKQKEN